jgi:outer membrane lipoprotein-sorting protein
MKRNLVLSAAIVLCACLGAAAQSNPTADEIISKNVAARGGLDKIKAIQSLRLTGKMQVGPGIEAPVTLLQKRPNMIRIEFTVQGMTGIQAYNGKDGFQVMPFQGSKDPQPLSADDLKDMEHQADFDGPLVDYKAKGNQVELVGKEPVEGADAYKLKVTLKDGDVQYDYVDTDSFLEVKASGKRNVRGTDVEWSSSMGDYKPVNGVLFPFAIEQTAQGSDQKMKIVVDTIEPNVQIADSQFVAPPPAPAPPAAPAKPPLALGRLN